MNMNLFKNHTPDDVAAALDLVLEGELQIADLGLQGVFVRRHDDTNGETGPGQEVLVTLFQDGVSTITLPDMPALQFRPASLGGKSPRTRNALAVLAYAIAREQADAPQDRLSQPVSPVVGEAADCDHSPITRALNLLAEGTYWIRSLDLQSFYLRKSDDAPEKYSPLHELQGTFGPDADVYLMAVFQSLRFREYSGGGMSLRTRNAIMVLCEAMRRDDAAAPR